MMQHVRATSSGISEFWGRRRRTLSENYCKPTFSRTRLQFYLKLLPNQLQLQILCDTSNNLQVNDLSTCFTQFSISFTPNLFRISSASLHCFYGSAKSFGSKDFLRQNFPNNFSFQGFESGSISLILFLSLSVYC